MKFSLLNLKERLSNKKNQQKKEPAKKNKFLEDGSIRFFVILAPILNLLAWLLVFIKLIPLPEPIILHYNAYFGVDLEGSGKEVLFLPAAGLFIFILNLFLGILFLKKDILITKIIFIASFFFNLILIIALAALISVNEF